MKMDFALEKKQIAYLQAINNYHPYKYLQQFNSCFQELLIREIPETLIWSLPKYQSKVQPCNCVKCGKIYASEQLAEEMGMCWSCHFTESNKCLSLSPPEQYILKAGKKPAGKLMPHFLGETLMKAIQLYFIEAFGRDFKFKNEAWKFINDKFNVNLSNRQVLSLLEVNVLRRAGLIPKTKQYN